MGGDSLMAVAILVGGRDAGQPDVGPTAVGRLAELGITRVSLLGDSNEFGIVVEGWAFDPGRVEEAVGALFPDGGNAVRVFREIEHVGVAPAARERST